jgi:hypothetical protein
LAPVPFGCVGSAAADTFGPGFLPLFTGVAALDAVAFVAFGTGGCVLDCR